MNLFCSTIIYFNNMETKIQHVCPWWLGYILLNPFRKFYHNPELMLKPYIKRGMKVVDYGCAMGYFSLPMAKLVGEMGQVYAIDIQQKMIKWLNRRVRKAGLEHIITPVLITENTDFNELTGQIDFALLFAMVHEVPDKKELFNTIGKIVKSGGTVLFAEPCGHVSLTAFENSITVASSSGFEESARIRIAGSHAVVLKSK
jgi:2-polyprenyl-3-methyl-5-hydroxy-6-metoxy-1,4-benzoquinol methylase